MSWRKPPSLPASATRSTCARYAGHSCIFHCVIGADAASAERLTPSLLVGKCCHWSKRPQHSFAHSPDRPRITSEPGIAEQGPQSHSGGDTPGFPFRSEEHTSELQSLMRISYAVFCLKKKKQ